jgi:hypothetical protein
MVQRIEVFQHQPPDFAEVLHYIEVCQTTRSLLNWLDVLVNFFENVPQVHSFSLNEF